MKKNTLKGSPLKQERVINTILQSIRQGELKPGERLAPLNEISERLEVSQSVAYRALQALVEDDMIECRGIRGFYVKENVFQEEKEQNREKIPAVAKEGRVFLFGTHHSDLVWKYPYDKYRKIREEQLNLFAEFFEKYEAFHAFIEQAEVLRVYFQDHPEKLPLFQRMHAEGRLALSGNNSIPDLNMVSGELIVRDIQSGLNYCRETFGKEPEIACYNDAFGMSGQLPQILKKSGFKYLRPGRRPNFPRSIPGNVSFRWTGIDGSSVFVFIPVTGIDFQACLCNAPYIRTPLERLYENLEHVRKSDFPGDMLVCYGTETAPLREEIFSMISRVNREPGNRTVEFGPLTDYLKKQDPCKLPEVKGEFNPMFTGCYTTRITVKQNLRKAENLLFAAELLSAGLGKTIDLDEAWHQLAIAAFHDGSCGCHSDPANRDVMAKLHFAQNQAEKELKRIAPQNSFAVLNPGSAGKTLVSFRPQEPVLPKDCPAQKEEGEVFFLADLPAAGFAEFPAEKRQIETGKKAPPVFRTKCFSVDFSAPYPKITDLKAGTDVFPETGFGEILFRHEPGSMWSERFGSGYFGREHQKETVVSCTAGDVFHQIITEGEVLPFPAEDGSDADYWDGFGSLKFRKIYRFYRELDYFTLKVVLDWKGENTKISIRFPVRLDVANASGTYDVPFGSMVRAPYYEVPQKYRETLKELNPEDYANAAGDWPALHWVDYSDLSEGLAIANAGTPGQQTVGGNICISLLRSGTMIADGLMKPQTGALDNGVREYEFAFRPHSAADIASAPELGTILNRRPLVLSENASRKSGRRSFFAVSPSNLRLSSIRPCDGGMIVRIYETAGLVTAAEFPSDFSAVQESDLKEREWKNTEPGKIVFAPLEIKTLKLTGKEGG